MKDPSISEYMDISTITSFSSYIENLVEKKISGDPYYYQSIIYNKEKPKDLIDEFVINSFLEKIKKFKNARLVSSLNFIFKHLGERIPPQYIIGDKEKLNARELHKFLEELRYNPSEINNVKGIPLFQVLNSAPLYLKHLTNSESISHLSKELRNHINSKLKENENYFDKIDKSSNNIDKFISRFRKAGNWNKLNKDVAKSLYPILKNLDTNLDFGEIKDTLKTKEDNRFKKKEEDRKEVKEKSRLDLEESIDSSSLEEIREDLKKSFRKNFKLWKKFELKM
jgi:hypothetical protein